MVWRQVRTSLLLLSLLATTATTASAFPSAGALAHRARGGGGLQHQTLGSSSAAAAIVAGMRGGAAAPAGGKRRVIPPSAPGLMVVGEGSLAEVEGTPTPTLWNVPNVLTLARLVAIPVLGAVFYAPLPARNTWCAALFAGAAITDWLDGWWARKYNIASPFGAFLDPVADKLIVAVALILLAERLGTWMTVCTSIILCREIGVSALREWMAQIGARGVVKVGMAGKVKTATQMVALTMLLLLQPGATAPAWLPAATFTIAKQLMVLSTVLTVTSGTGYLQAAWPTLTGKEPSAASAPKKK